MDLNPSSSCNSILESLKLHLPSFDFDSSSENEEDVIFERQAGLSPELRERITEDSLTSSSLMEEAELQPGACENNIKKLQGAKLNVETHVDNTNPHEHFPVLSFAKLDQVDLDKVLQNLKEDGRCLRQCVPAEPPKICADYDTGKSHSNIMDRLVAFCMSQSAGAACEPVHARITENNVWNKSPDRMAAKSQLSQRGRSKVHIDLLCPEPAIKLPTCSEISSESSNTQAKHNPRQETPSAKTPASTVQPGPCTTQREITCKSMLKVTEMNGNGDEHVNNHTDPQDSLQGKEVAEAQHQFCPAQSGKREQTTNREAKQQSDQQRRKVQQKLKRKQRREIHKELEKLRPTKSVRGNQPAAEKTSVLYDGEASHLQPIPALPADIESKACVLLTVNLCSPGMAAGRSHGEEQDLNSAVTNVDVCNTLVAWCLSLVGPGPLWDEDEAGVAVPFRVEGLQQVWQNDGLGLHVLVSPHHCRTSERGHGHGHNNPPSFYDCVCRFLSQTPLSVVARWLPELRVFLDQQAYAPPIHLPASCLSSFISATSEQKVIDMTLGLSPGFYWQTLETRECVCQSRETRVTPELHTGVTLALGSSAFFLHPLVTHYTLQLILDLGLDVCGLRLLYPPHGLLSGTPGGKLFIQNDDEACQPVLAVAVRGPHALSVLQNLTSSLDALLARETDPASTHGLHCRNQHLPVFYSYQQARRVHRELCFWFAGRLPEGNAQNYNHPLNRVAPSEDRIRSSVIDLSTSSAFLCATTQADILLVVSPVVAPRCYGGVLAVCERRAFSVRGLQRLQIHSQGAKVLRLTKQQALVFCSRPAVRLDQEEVELHSRCLVLLLRRENILRHSVSLPAALMRDFEAQGLLGCIGSRLDDALSVEPSCCFHTVPYSSDMFLSFVRDMWAVPDPSRVVLSRQKCEAEVQQVVILTLCGKDMSQGLSLLHRALTGESEGDVRRAGFELLTLKWLPALTGVQAQELSPYEVGEPHWRGSLDSLMSYPALACALRGVDALASLRQLLPQDYPGDLSVLMSPTPEVAFRQASVLFLKHILKIICTDESF